MASCRSSIRAASLVLLVCASFWASRTGLFAEPGDYEDEVDDQGTYCIVSTAKCETCNKNREPQCVPGSWCYAMVDCDEKCSKSACCKDNDKCKADGGANCKGEWVDAKTCSSEYRGVQGCRCQKASEGGGEWPPPIVPAPQPVETPR
jgi:hypothetical protein